MVVNARTEERDGSRREVSNSSRQVVILFRLKRNEYRSSRELQPVGRSDRHPQFGEYGRHLCTKISLDVVGSKEMSNQLVVDEIQAYHDDRGPR